MLWDALHGSCPTFTLFLKDKRYCILKCKVLKWDSMYSYYKSEMMDKFEIIDKSDLDSLPFFSGDGDGSVQSEQNLEITRRHWVRNDKRPFCMNKACNKRFTKVLDRQHHCRKCGEIFCADCLKFKLKLNFLAFSDPLGKTYKVCKQCYEADEDGEVVSRSLTMVFRECKSWTVSLREGLERRKSSLAKTWRDKLNMSVECERLKKGFESSVGTSEVTRTLSEMKNMLKTPDWQKSSVWMQESLAIHCQTCHEGFGLLKKKYSCKLCGKVLCKTCSRRELLVYIPDQPPGNGPLSCREACLSVIKVIGSPEVEPEISMLLHVCGACRQYVVDLQLAKVEQMSEVTEVKDTEEGVISKLAAMDGTLSKLQKNIIGALVQYQDVVESLEDSRSRSREEGNTKVLAKTQEDLSDHFASFCVKVPILKKMSPYAETDTQSRLLKAYIKAKSDFYLDNVFTFRMLKRKLNESAPPQVLEYIQKIVDKNAIVSAQVYVKQLTFEAIYLSDKHSLQGQPLQALLVKLYEVVEEDTSRCLLRQGEDIDAHNADVSSIVRSQVKSHRLIRPSRTKMVTQGSHHVASILLSRLSTTLHQVSVQLDMKTINRSFPDSKTAVKTALQEAESLTVKDLSIS